MSRHSLSIAFFILLISGLAFVVLHDSRRCTDPSGCIQVSPESPLEIGILVSPPGTNCPPANSRIETLETLAANAASLENIPLRIVKEESGFSLSSSQQALARLLSRPNLLGIWMQDCPYGKDPLVRKLISDARGVTWVFTPQNSESDFESDVEGLICQINALRNGKTAHFLLGRSPFREEK